MHFVDLKNFKIVAIYKFKYFSKLTHKNLFDCSSQNKVFELEKKSNSIQQSFSFDQESHNLKPFEVLQIEKQLKLINIGSEITALDWCIDYPITSATNSKSVQYFAFASKNANLFNIPLHVLQELDLNDSVYNYNIIYIGKLTNLNSKDSKLEIFGIFDKNIGTINCLKWGVLNSKKSSIGYLLAASSNGNGYIYLVDDILSKPNDSANEHKKMFSINAINCYEPKNKITLKSNSSHECLSADWNQHNDKIQVALGYDNGSVFIFDLDDLFTRYTFDSASPIDFLKWSKSDSIDDKQIYTASTLDNAVVNDNSYMMIK